MIHHYLFDLTCDQKRNRCFALQTVRVLLFFFFCILLFALYGCDQNNNPHNSTYEQINGRNKSPIYRIKVPSHWIKKDLSQTIITDTINPIAEFYIDHDIRVTIHNFPSEKITDRVPVSSQITRWKKQFSQLHHSSSQPQAFAGYSGELIVAEGILQNKETTLIGWSMQLAQEHYRQLQDSNKKGDFTIKIVGPTALIAKQKLELIAFGRSFELIEEIPERL